MEFFETAAKRFSYRGVFRDMPVPKEDIEKIMKTALQAPAARAVPSNSFVVVTDPAIRQALAEIFPHPGIASAPVNIVVVTEHIEPYPDKKFELQNYAAAVQNILLAATALDYASLWTDGDMADGKRGPAMAKLLGVPEGKTVRAVLPLGVPEAMGEPKEKGTLASLVHYNKY